MPNSLNKKLTALMLLAVLLMLTACNSQSEGSFIKIDKQDEQFAKMQQELDDLKTIEVKYIPRERMEKFQKIIYKHYFRRNDDKKHQEATIDKNEDGTEHTIVYNTKDIYQLMEWGETYIYYNGTVFGEEQYYKKTGKDYCYEPIEEAVIQKEIKKLFERLGLPYGDKKNGYVIDREIIQGDNSVVVYMKRYIDEKELTLAYPPTQDMPEKIDDVEITLGNNQIIGINLRRLSETVNIKNYDEEISVNSPQKAYKLFANYILSMRGSGELDVDVARIAYMASEEKNGVYTLEPRADFYTTVDDVKKVYQVNLITKEVWDNIYCENRIFNI